MQTWKPLLMSILGILEPFLYEMFFGALVGFPLDSATFTGLLIYSIGQFIGGWSVLKMVRFPNENTFFLKAA